MDGADCIDSVVLNQIFFKGRRIVAPVEELIAGQLCQGYLSIIELTEYQNQPKQS